MKDAKTEFYRLENFIPSLRQEFDRQPLNLKQILRAGVPVKPSDGTPAYLPSSTDRTVILVTDGKSSFVWHTDSLRALFRGNQQPPVLGDSPEAYQEAFVILEMHVLEISKIFGDRRDAEMREIYSALRRRPDSRSLGFVHDYMWQAAALVLATQPLSQAEFEAIVARLERSCRTFEMGAGSRNYVNTLHMTFG